MLKPLKTPRKKNLVIRLFTHNILRVSYGFLRVNYGQITDGGILRVVTAGISQSFRVKPGYSRRFTRFFGCYGRYGKKRVGTLHLGNISLQDLVALLGTPQRT